MDQSSVKKLNVWPTLVALAISISLLWLVVRQLDLPSLGRTLLHLRIAWLLWGILVFGVVIVLTAWRWHLMLRLTGCTVHSQATLRTTVIGHFFNTLLFGITGGDIAKSIVYSRWYGHLMTEVLTSSLLDRVLGLGGLFLFFAGAAGLAIAHGASSALDQLHLTLSRSSWWAGGLICLGLALTAFGLRTREPESFIARFLGSLFAAGKRLLRSPRPALLGLWLSFLIHLGSSGVFALCLQSTTESSVPWSRLLWTIPVISILSSLPITFAGSGIREGASLVLLGLYGVSAADAVAASLLTLVVYAFWAASGGWLWWLEQRRETPKRDPGPLSSLSVVIPTLNEAQTLGETVSHARKIAGVCEMIVVDGGSQDGTAELARTLGCRVLSSARGRGGQMRLGAMKAVGDVVLLLHADTWLAPEAGHAILDCLRDRTVIGGGFWKVFRNPSWLMRGSRFRCALRLYLGGRIAGDQTIFVRRRTLENIGGVPDMPLMEEFELCRRLRKAGRLALAGAIVNTSTRRFRKLGTIRTYLRMWRVSMQYRLGTPPQELLRIYEKD